MKEKDDLSEKERVNALKEYDILDTLPEEDYDDLARLAREVCDAKIAAITLIDEEKEWFKSQVGVGTQIQDIPRPTSICEDMLKNKDVTVIEDCSKDPRFTNNPVLRHMARTGMYAAAPLITPVGYIIGSLCVFADKPGKLTTDQVQALKVLAKQVVKLLELKKLNKQLINSGVKLENRLKEMEQFSYAVSHDLKGPVKNISALIGLLKMQFNAGRYQDVDLYMSKIVKESDRMSNLVTDLLAYSLVGKSTQLREWIYMQGVVDDVKLGMEQKLAEHNASIIYSGVEQICAVRSDIERLLQNLLENAVKFRRKDIAPEIKITCSEKNEFWELAIRDNGIGMNMADTEKIFEIFSRLHTREQYQGTGIGLAMCKKIAENHNGSIRVESLPGQGSTFYVLIRKPE